MTGSVYPEQGALPGVKLTGTTPEDATAGTYALRRLHYFHDAKQDAPLSGETLQIPEIMDMDDDFDSEQSTLIQHLRMVASIARQYAHRGVEGVELLKAGNLGLIHALEHFQLGKATHFSGYAEMCIRQHIERSIAERQKCLEVAQTTPQYATSPVRRTTLGVGSAANHQGIYVIRAFIESRINELQRPRHVGFLSECSGL